jgi:tRNA nucleotidyltransferase/poly(A) polymerase
VGLLPGQGGQGGRGRGLRELLGRHRQPAPPQYAENQKRYVEEQKEIQAKAKELEKERDAKSEEADHLLHRHHRFANSVALLQVSIALGAVAALTRSRLVWFGSMAVGAFGIVLVALTFVG